LEVVDMYHGIRKPPFSGLAMVLFRVPFLARELQHLSMGFIHVTAEGPPQNRMLIYEQGGNPRGICCTIMVRLYRIKGLTTGRPFVGNKLVLMGAPSVKPYQESLGTTHS
jgi:hypothetical protein